MKKFLIAIICIILLGGGGFFGYKSMQKSKITKMCTDLCEYVPEQFKSRISDDEWITEGTCDFTSYVSPAKSGNYDDWYEDYEVNLTLKDEFGSLSDFEKYDTLSLLDEKARQLITDIIDEKYPNHSELRSDIDKRCEVYGKNLGTTWNIDGKNVVFISGNDTYKVSTEFQYYTINDEYVDIEELQKEKELNDSYSSVESASDFVGTWYCKELVHKERTTKMFQKDNQTYIGFFVDDEKTPREMYIYNGNDDEALYNSDEKSYIVLKSKDELEVHSVDSENKEVTIIFGRDGSGIDGYRITPAPEPVEPYIGMTEDELNNSTWGKPEKVNKTIFEWGVSEQWCYSGYRYIYLENGVVNAIQE